MVVVEVVDQVKLAKAPIGGIVGLRRDACLLTRVLLFHLILFS